MTTHTMSVLVENKPGVLAHVAALFSRRAVNISSLSVGPTRAVRVRRMTLVVDGEGTPVDQVHKQLEKLVRVLKVVELAEDEAVERELALIKVTVRPQLRADLLDVAASFRANVVDLDPETIVLEAVCSPGRLDALLGALEPHGTSEVVRTGLIAIGRGSSTITDEDDSVLADCA
jgi:acetolactate synthase-1/3 small subunit